MPRISKRKQIVSPIKSVEKPTKVYKAAIYARLSSDQNERKNESVEVQIDIAKKYIDNMIQNGEMIELVDVYCDLGKTGSNFSRDEFSRMMQDIRLSEVNCVIVKDLSRFGRNYLEAGNYIEKIFPFLGVRFIAVSDGFDTQMQGNDNKKMAMNIKNLVNDMYAKDFSKKAKIHLQQRRDRGSYVGGPTPYGYTYEWVDKNKKLIIEADTKPVVELIFHTFTREKSYAAVTKLLNQRRINPPMIYKKTKAVFCPVNEEYKGWDKVSVTRILKNETYIGTLTQGKTSITARDEKNRVKHDKSKWTIVENCHVPLVSREMFDKVHSIMEEIHQKSSIKNRKADLIPLPENVFDDVLTCGLCGRKMTRHSHVKIYENGDKKRLECYDCLYVYNSKIDHVCESNRISKEILSDILLSTLRVEFAIYLEKPKFYVERNKTLGQEKKAEYQSIICKIDRKIERMEEEESSQYIRYRSEEITQEQYVEMKLKNAGKKEELLKNRRIQEECIRTLEQVIEKQNKEIRSLLKLDTVDELTKEFVDSLVEKIYVYPGKRVEIIYTFSNRNEFEAWIQMEGIL